jgi:hypothetical protein
MPLKVNETSAEVAEMAREWPMLQALMAGTSAMRAGGRKYLPKFPNEEQAAYDARLATATLFPAFRRTVAVMAGKPFSKPVTLSESTPAEIVEWAEDIDREGVNLHSFASEMMVEALAYGICGILVEAPKRDPARPVPTVADQKAAGVRPYFVRIKHDQILGWKISRGDGPPVLTQLRLKETAEVSDGGEFGTTVVEQVRVLEPGKFTVYQRVSAQGSSEMVWAPVDSGETGLPVIPFVPLYGFRTSLMVGAPPLLDLAHLNVKHWQSQSDQDTILHAARVPLLVAVGFEDKDEITVGASSAIKSSNPSAKVEWVEHTGSAIGSGSQSLAALEEQMVQAGAELLIKKPGARSATESAGDQEANKSDLQRITETFENGLDQALQLMADYASLGDAGDLTLFKDFGASLLTDASGNLVLTAEAAEVISTRTAITELQRRGTLSSDIDPEAEIAAIRAQPPKVKPPAPGQPPKEADEEDDGDDEDDPKAPEA